MKVIAALALLSVALASPVAQPVPVVLPEPAKPAIETSPFVANAEPIDISPVFVPLEIVEAMKLAEINPEAVIFVDVAENIEYEPVALSAIEEEMPSFGLDLVEVAEGLDFSEDTGALFEEVSADAEEVVGDAVHFVEVAENVDNAEVDLLAGEVAGDAVHFVEVAENIDHAEVAPVAEEVAGDAVNFVEVAENIDNADFAPLTEEVSGDAVHFVEVAENIDNAEVAEGMDVADAEEIPAEAVKFVDFAAEDQAVAEEAAAFASEIGSQVNFVEVAENIDFEEPAVRAEEIPADAVHFVDAPLRYPAKVYDNPMLR